MKDEKREHAPFRADEAREGFVPVRPARVGARHAAGSSSCGARPARMPWRVVFWVAIAVAVVAIAALVGVFALYAKGSAAYDRIADDAFSAPAADAEGQASLAFEVDWDALLAENPDTVGWIYVPGTTINYPIVYSGDDMRYLREDFHGETNPLVSFGAIFLSGVNTPDFSDEMNIVYGHHLLNGAMFSPFADFADEAVFNEHRAVYLLTPNGTARLRSFALLHASMTDPIVQPSFATAEERAAYVGDKMAQSIVAPEGDVPAAEDIPQVFAFSTCDSLAPTQRYILFCYTEESTDPSIRAAG